MRLSQKDIVKYWILSGILYWLFFDSTPFAGDVGVLPNSLRFAFSFISRLISVVGFVACYRSNGGSSGERLLDKFTALFFVSSVRGLVYVAVPLALACSVTLAGIYYDIGEIDVYPTYLAGAIVFLIYKASVYLLTARCLNLLHVRSVV